MSDIWNGVFLVSVKMLKQEEQEQSRQGGRGCSMAAELKLQLIPPPENFLRKWPSASVRPRLLRSLYKAVLSMFGRLRTHQLDANTQARYTCQRAVSGKDVGILPLCVRLLLLLDGSASG